MSNEAIITVSEFAQRVTSQVRSITQVQIRGVIGRILVSRSGHAYFDIKDEQKDACISCVSWSGLPIPKPGLCEIFVSKMDFYAPSGKCQAIVNSYKTVTDTTPKASVLDRLNTEGLVHRKKLPLPDIVQHLCLVTSSGSAAAHDMLKSIEERWPGLRTTLIHTAVQGPLAPAELIKALDAARNLTEPPDVIICGRGGGSENDLQAFDNEEVARSFASGQIPVISAVGHESDYSVTDAVADVRSKTPTAAIELALPVSHKMRMKELADMRHTVFNAASRVLNLQGEKLKNILELGRNHMQRIVSSERTKLSFLRDALSASTAHRMAADRLLVAKKTLHAAAMRTCVAERKRLLKVRHDLQSHLRTNIDRAELELSTKRSALDAHALPTAWSRGFFTLTDQSKQARVRKLDEIAEGAELCVRGADYVLHVTVKKCQRVL